MIIEDFDALKTWLSKTLEPICDADPSALAKYVVALVKKDKSEKELKALCIDQLDVFLQKETQTFVDKLFEAVNAKSYLPQPEPPVTTVKTEKGESKREEDKSRDQAFSRDEDREKKFSRRINHSPPSSSRYSRDSRRIDDRKKDERSRKREYDRNPPRRDAYRERYNRRRERSRSYSRSRSRSWSKDRSRDRERDRDRDWERSRSRSRTRSRSRERDSAKSKYEHSRPERQEGASSDSYTPPPLVPGNTSAIFPVPTLSSTITVIAPTHHGNSTTESWSEFPQEHTPFIRGGPLRKRCRDYDEKGFCMRGDMCLFDHGSDPVVVEDVNLPRILPFQPPPLPVVDGPPPPGLPPPHALLTPPVNLRPPVPPPGTMPPSLPPVAGPPPPLPALQPSGMDAPPNSITSSVPTIVTSGIRPPITQPPPPLFSSDSFEPDVYNPEAPSMNSRPMYRHGVNVQRSNLIGLTMGNVDLPPREKMSNNNSPRIVLDTDSRKLGARLYDGGIPAKKPWHNDHNFNKLNHHGFQRRGPYPLGNTKLVIQMIPPELNNISKLNEHFSKFGTIVNLQVAYKNDPEGALIQFSCPDQARRAYESTEAVLNNRFIKMQWYREDTSRHMHNKPWPSVQFTQHSAETTPQPSVKDRLGPMPTAHPEPASSSTSPNPSKITVREPLGLSELEGHGAKVPSTSSGLTKTVYNPAALKSIQKGAQFGTNVIADDVQKRKQEAMKLQKEIFKKKQGILEKHIQTQKLLVSKLEKSKSKKEKTLIMQAITSLTITITKLQEEIKGLPPPNAFRTTIKSKAQAQKELLDTELDLYKKTQSGEDIADLKIKCTQLQLEAAKMGLLTPCRGRGAHIRGRGALRSRGRGIRGRGRGLPTHAVVDHRPRALEISGFTENDVVDLLPHFAQYGEIEDCQMEDSSLSAIITFKTRAEAEQAAVHGVRLNKQELHLAWHKPTTSLNTTDPDEGEPEDEEFAEDSLVDDSLLQDDEEEEEDNESRSWRR